MQVKNVFIAGNVHNRNQFLNKSAETKFGKNTKIFTSREEGWAMKWYSCSNNHLCLVAVFVEQVSQMEIQGKGKMQEMKKILSEHPETKQHWCKNNGKICTNGLGEIRMFL